MHAPLLALGILAAAAGADGPTVVQSTVVGADDAGWIRLRFGQVALAGSPTNDDASWLRITSLEDGAVQLLDAAAIERWNGTSAYFNGGHVQVELLAWPGTGPNWFDIDSIVTPEPHTQTSICGGIDDRLPSNDPRVGRVLPVLCTVFLIDEQCFLTAGHCSSAAGLDVVQFNVPESDADGSINHPAPEHQYPVDDGSLQFTATGQGDDWGFFGTFENANTGFTPRQAQGAAFVVPETQPEPDGGVLRITGYGTDASPPEWNRFQQSDTGTYDTFGMNVVAYDDVDTSGGSSGSPVEHVGLGVVLAIHTHGGCNVPEIGSNFGTAMSHPGLRFALENPMGVCGLPCPWDLDDDDDVGVPDLVELISRWGHTPGHQADFDGNGDINVLDLVALLTNWGPCPE